MLNDSRTQHWEKACLYLTILIQMEAEVAMGQWPSVLAKFIYIVFLRVNFSVWYKTCLLINSNISSSTVKKKPKVNKPMLNN